MAWSIIFFFSWSDSNSDLHSFPTRRSSDLHRSMILTAVNRSSAKPFLGSECNQPAILRIWLNLNPTIRMLDYIDRKSTRLNSSHVSISYAVFCLKKKIMQYLFELLKHFDSD